MITTKKYYPKIKLRAGHVSEKTFFSYMATCVDVENTRTITELNNKPSATVPKFLSSNARGKALDANCYEAWLELAPYLPKPLVTKAKPYIRTLATTLQAATVAKLLGACAANIQDGEDTGILELSEFTRTVEASRKTAEAMGLHRSELDDLLLPPVAETTAPVVEAIQPVQALSFSERAKLRKAGLL